MTDNALYLEVDEDITSAIDKLAKVQGTSVQIVVPKRSTMLQSMINLKLLKKAAENNGKQLVLVTNDRIATDLAARVGLAVAPSIGAKPVIKETSMPEQLKDSEEVINADDPEPPATPMEPVAKPISAKPKRLSLKRKELSDASAAAAVAADAADDGEDAPAVKPGKPIKVPNWNTLQKRAMWIGLAAIIIGGYFVMMYLYAGAKVVVFANAQKTPIAVDFTVDPSQSQSNYANTTLAGKTISVTKTLSGQFTATGQQDVGTKASGTITVYNCLDGNTHTLVAGTRFEDSNGNIFKSTSDISVPGGQGSFAGCSTPGTATVSVQADQNGSQYNEGPGSYTIPGLPSSEQTGQDAITAKGATMSGGTSNIVTVVQQSDVDTAQAAVLAADKNNITGDLSGQIPKGYVGINSSQSSSASNVTPAPAVDAQATSATLTMQVTYKELIIQQSDYKQLLDTQEASQVGNDSQIYDDGYSQILLTQSGTDNNGAQSFHLTTQAYSGPKIDTASIAKQIAGKRYGDAVDFAKGLAGVTDAQISIWPAWSSNLPTQADKIHVSIKVANQSS
jgi:hypothetical protein